SRRPWRASSRSSRWPAAAASRRSARGCAGCAARGTTERVAPRRPLSSEQRPRVEALERDHADTRQRDRERADVVLEVVELEPVRREVGEDARDELAEPDDADAPVAGLEERRDERREVAV